MNFQFVQGKSNGTTGTSVAITLDAPATVNNLIIVNIRINDATTTVSSVVDNASNTYAAAVGPIGDQFRIYQYYGVQITGGATVITVNINTSAGVRGTIDEFSGGQLSNVAVFDKASSGTGTAQTSSSVSSFSPAVNGSLISAHIANEAITSPVAGTNYTLSESGTNFISEYKLSSNSSETAPASWTNSSNWAQVAGIYIPLLEAGFVFFLT